VKPGDVGELTAGLSDELGRVDFCSSRKLLRQARARMGDFTLALK
jgi:hypothetical protein